MIKAIKVSLQGESQVNFDKFISERLKGVKDSLNSFHKDKLPKYRRLYEALPAEEIRSTPWKGASNLVIPLVAMHTDTLLARVMSAILKMRPLWPVKLTGDFQGRHDEIREALQTYMTEQAIEPEAWDLYRMYKLWFKDAINVGLGTAKLPWETKIETEVILNQANKPEYSDFIKYDGPKPQHLPLEDFFFNASDLDINDSWFKAHRRRLSRQELQYRAARGLYDKAVLDEVLKQPDRTGPEAEQAEKESDAGINRQQDDYNAEYDIYECHAKYQFDNRIVKVIVAYHEHSNKVLRRIYYPFPDDVFETACLFPRDGVLIGYGFAEMLENFEEELSSMHNNRRDAQTVANAKIWRIDPDSGIAANYEIFPSCKLPAAKDEVEAIAHGEPSPFQIDEERMLLDLAERRTGVTPPQQGYGSGQSQKRGVYSAVATLSLLQEGNTRGDMNISDLRAAHMRLGRKIAKQISELGLSRSRFSAYGDTAAKIFQAFQFVKNETVSMPILAATAALNNEVEKQSDMIIVGLLRQHYQATAALLGQLSMPGVPPDVKTYVAKTVQAADTLMRAVVRHFGYDDVDRLVPKAIASENPNESQSGSLGTQPGNPIMANGNVTGQNLLQLAGSPAFTGTQASGGIEGYNGNL